MSARCGVGTSALRPRRCHKERSKNFTELEKRTVLELIARHRDVLRQGRSNNATNRSKQLVWSTICEEVNKRCGGDRPRTPAQVKMWYENYKKKCKMRAHETQPIPTTQVDAPSLLDGMLWQSINPLDVKDEETDAATSVDGTCSVKDDDCEPVNMSNGRQHDEESNVLEPHVQITQPHIKPQIPLLHNPIAMDQVRLRNLQYLHKLNAPLNLSESEGRRGDEGESRGAVSDEEKLYYAAKRQHAVWEHEAKMKILNMELRQKEEIFSLQKQLFLVELKLKMDFLEKAANK